MEVEVVVERHPRMQQAALVASVFGAVLGLGGDRAEAAVVRGVQVLRDATTTRIVVEVDGDIRFHSRPSEDGKAVFVDLEDSTLDGGVPRLLPVADKRVDGVLLLGDEETRVVRVSVDVAGRGRASALSRVEGSRLFLDFTAASAVPAAAALAAASPPAAAAAPARPRSARAEDAIERKQVGVPDARELRAAKARALATQAAAARATTDRAEVPERSRRPAVRETVASPPVATATARAAGPLPRRSIVERPVVVLDPGHGGRDPGARAWTGEVEKDIVLDLAERVARRLRARGDLEVVLTRTGDEYVELEDRRDASRRWGADAFVSIHANASHNVAARGVETYYHSRTTTDRGMRRLVRAENGGRSGKERPVSSSRVASNRSGLTNASLSPSSSPLPDRRPESIRLARAVQGELVRQLGMRYEAVRDLGAKEGPFFVIGDNAAPSVLVEAAFLTHREEGLRMRSEVYREQIADGVARGIVAFLDQQVRAQQVRAQPSREQQRPAGTL